MEPIILLHGALGTARTLLPLSKILDTHAEVHILDFSGHGDARWPEPGFNIETFERDVLKLLDARSIESAHIFGYSMGGFVGLRLAAKHPARVKSLTTLAMKLAWDEATCAKEAGSLDADALEAKAPRFVSALDAAHSRAGWRRVVEATQAMLADMHQYRFSAEELAEIQTPVRLMLGDRDTMVSLAETVEAFEKLPNGELAVLPGTPHPLEKADVDLLTDFILPMLAK